jgi:hypothetical protein
MDDISEFGSKFCRTDFIGNGDLLSIFMLKQTDALGADLYLMKNIDSNLRGNRALDHNKKGSEFSV